MKHTALLLLLTLIGLAGSFLRGPFYGVAIYYLFATLRPQYLWEWALAINLRWSLYVALSTALACLFWNNTKFLFARFGAGGNAMFFFAVWVTLSNFLAINFEVSSYHYVEYFKIFVMFFVAYFTILQFYQLQVLYNIAALSIAYIAYEMNYIYFFFDRLDIYSTGYGGLDNNGAALMIAMGMPLVYFLWEGTRQWWRCFYLAILPIMLHAVLMSYSRGAMLSLLLSIPLIVIRSAKKKAMAGAIIGLLVLLPILAGEQIRERFFTVGEYAQDDSANLRFQSWLAALEIAADHPVFGAGVRNSDLLSYQYGTDREGRSIHSVFLQIAADSGFPALALYLVTLFITWRGLRNYQVTSRSSSAPATRLAYSLACGIECALAIFCVGAAFLSMETFELPYLLILMALRLPEVTVEGE